MEAAALYAFSENARRKPALCFCARHQSDGADRGLRDLVAVWEKAQRTPFRPDHFKREKRQGLNPRRFLASSSAIIY
jgi:hypothetical protein